MAVEGGEAMAVQGGTVQNVAAGKTVAVEGCTVKNVAAGKTVAVEGCTAKTVRWVTAGEATMTAPAATRDAAPARVLAHGARAVTKGPVQAAAVGR
jgi:hypothetical protein